MKRCKSCGTMVHIESNTCPNCGAHSFEVLDVKICPLCGKVNGIESSFCEYCGKNFDGGGFTESAEQYGSYDEASDYVEAAPAEESFPTKRAISDSERAMLRYLTLRPEVSTDGKEKKYAYYVSDENVPIVILPTFETEKEKNVKVEIMLVPETRQVPADSVVVSDERAGDASMRLQLPKETPRNGDLFVEHKISRAAQLWFSLLLTLFAAGALVGFFLPMAGPGRATGFALIMGMIGNNAEGAAVVELLKAGGILGRVTYVGILILFSLFVAGVVLNLCFLRHSRAKKAILIAVLALTLAAFALLIVGNVVVLDTAFGSMGIGVWLMGGFLLVQLLFNVLLYNR